MYEYGIKCQHTYDGLINLAFWLFFIFIQLFEPLFLTRHVVLSQSVHKADFLLRIQNIVHVGISHELFNLWKKWYVVSHAHHLFHARILQCLTDSEVRIWTQKEDTLRIGVAVEHRMHKR